MKRNLFGGMLTTLFGLLVLIETACGGPTPLVPTTVPQPTPTVIAVPTVSPTPSRVKRPDKYCTTLVEDFGQVKINAATAQKPRGEGQEPLTIYHGNGTLVGNTTSAINVYTASFLDNAGQPLPATVPYPNYYLAEVEDRKVLGVDAPAQRKFVPNIDISSLTRSSVGIITPVEIDPYTIGLRYKIRGGGHPLVAKVYVNDDMLHSEVLSSGFLQYQEQAENGYITAFLNLLNAPPVKDGTANVELRVESLTNNTVHIQYESELQRDPQGRITGITFRALGDIGTSADLERLEVMYLCK